ncbi:MAG: extracellular solute-binding protein [Planctomycetes bacterium]|nr:extracellular solute-binding protein [Planctomycetota bacterium]
MNTRQPGIRPLIAVAMGLLSICGCTRPAGPEVVVYVAVDRGQSEPILKEFESQTGIRVRALYDAEAAKTTGLVTRLMAESAAPCCDVFWNNEQVQTLMLADRQLLDRYEPSSAAGVPPRLCDPHGNWTGIAARARVIVYNTKHVAAADAPRSLFDLTDPKWKGKVAVANPQFGTTRTHVAALFAVLGRERACRYLRELLANDVRIVDGNAMVKNLVARADPDASPIYVGLTDTDDVLSGQADGEPVAMVYPDQDAFGTLVVPSTVCLIRGAANPEPARRLVDYLASPEVERKLAEGRAGFIPLRAETPSGRAIDQLGRPKAMEPTPEELLEQLEPSSTWTRQHFHP